MSENTLWQNFVRSTAHLEFSRHATVSVVCGLLLPIMLFVGFGPLPAPMERLTAVRGVIEEAEIRDCFTRARKPWWGLRRCIDGSAVTFRDQNGVARTAVFRLPDDPPFDAQRFPRGAIFDVLVSKEDLNSGYNQFAEAVAVNGAVLKPLKDERLTQRIGALAFAVVAVLVLASFVGRLMQKRADTRA